MCNNTNKCGCEPICGCQQPCSCPCPCQPTPCDEGCLTDTKTDCVFLSSDLDICSEILPKGSTVTEALTKLGGAVCDGVTVTVQDMKVKVDANDTTSGYLFDKLTVCNNLEKTVTNINGNETLQLCTKIDNTTGGNILTSGPNGLYVPTPTPTGYTLTPLFSNTVGLTINPIVGGQSIKADVKISPNAGNLLVDNGGLYVSIPTLPNPITVSKLDTNSITTNIVLTGSNYQISSNLKLDPTSTAPVSITANGLKVDCCQPIIPANTPITIIPTTSVALTASGIDSHTLQASVIISPSAGNALQSTPNGLYCPAPGTSTPTTIIDTPTVDATLINPTTYSLSVKPSLDSCNALTTGSDGGVYVNGSEMPNTLSIFSDGAGSYIFEFSGVSSLNTDYEVEFRGTLSNPALWVNGDANYIGLNGSALNYTLGNDCLNPVAARVRYKCGTNTSQWASVTKVLEIPRLASPDGSITITPGTCGEANIQIVSPFCTNDFACTAEIKKIGNNFFTQITRVNTSNFSDVYTVEIRDNTTADFVGGSTISDELVTLVPMLEYTPGNSYEVWAVKHCTRTNTPTATVTVPIASGTFCAEVPNWTVVPPSAFMSGIISGQPYTASSVLNTNALRYRIVNNRIEFTGMVRIDVGGTGVPGVVGPPIYFPFVNFLDLTQITPCANSTAPGYPSYFNPQVFGDYDYDTLTQLPSGTFEHFFPHKIQQVNTTLQFDSFNQTIPRFDCFLSLSGMSFELQ